METRGSYILVGAFVLALVAAAVAIAIWFAKVEFERAPARYLVYFTGNVTGLNIGSAVRYRGVPVGRVAEIGIDPANVERVRVVIEIAAATPIKRDTTASLGLQGITGIAYIQLSGGTQASPDRRPARAGELPVIPSKLSGLEKVLEQAPEIIEKVVILTDRLSRLVDDRNLKSVRELLENMRNITAKLGADGGDLDRLLREGRDTLAALRSAAETTQSLAGDLRQRADSISGSADDALTDAQVTLADIREAVRSINDTAELLNDVIAETRTPLSDFSQGGLYELSQFIAEARVLVAALTRLAAQIERDPARFFFGDTQKGFEPK